MLTTHRRTSTSDPGLFATGIGVEFAGVSALADVSLQVRRGEIVGLIGPNGAGKTTMINVLSGYQRASSGRISLDGRDVTRWPAHRLVGLGLARTFQAVRPFPDLTTFDNVLTGALAATSRIGEARQRTVAMLDRMGLAAWRDHAARSLPYGMLRLLGLARALVTEPAYLLVDEPAAGMHEAESMQLAGALVAIRDDLGCGLIVVEHDMTLVMGICERIHVLDSGRTIAEGAPDVVRSHPEVLRAYLGSAAAPGDEGIRAARS